MAKDLEIALKITAKDNTQAAFGRARAGVGSIPRQLEAARTAFLSFRGVMGLKSSMSGWRGWPTRSHWSMPGSSPPSTVRSLGLAQEQVARTTEATAQALKVSGDSAAEAASALRVRLL